MRKGQIVAGRFELVELAGRGGMGSVYRAIDVSNGAVVALKLLHDAAEDASLRFAHEARILGAIEHPHVVRYVTHGQTGEGEPYLVMEWLEGETLADRLGRERLGVEEAVGLARRLAGALAAAHARGVVHRDLKPSNIFLRGHSLADIKLLDFGIARIAVSTKRLTQTGALLGTPGYMAPEQARGERDAVDARADVFSLGCVLFECLTGKPAFVGVHVMALLAKLLMEEPTRPRELRPEISEALEALVLRMLSKEPADRPHDGGAVVAAIDRLGALEAGFSLPRPRAREALTDVEKRLVSVVAVAPRGGKKGEATPGASTLDLLEASRRVVKPFGARVEEIADGVILVLLVGTGLATDQAVMAARCALAIRDLAPDSEIVLLTGRGEHTGRSPVGDIFDSAASMLSDKSERPCIRMDENSRSLLEGRFEIVEEKSYLVLGPERGTGEARTLLGKSSPFVGRERETRYLMDLCEESFEEKGARVSLVTGEAGMGKSRLLSEFLRRCREAHPEALVAIGRGDSMAAGSAFSVIASALLGFFGLAAGADLEEQRKKLGASLGMYLPAEDLRRVAMFLGEIVGTPFPDADEPKLRAARQNPSLMAEQVQSAFLKFLDAATSSRLVVFVLEDLHWGDLPTVKLIDAALRDLSDRPLVVLAFARPEVKEVFPKLWAGREVQEMTLGRLSKRAAEALARSVLGSAVEPELLRRIVERADGHAFFLEELLRAAAEGRRGELPESVIGMVEARISRLDPEARRTLRAASVFGEAFWERGVRALLGEAFVTGGRSLFEELCGEELISKRKGSRISGEEEYVFRHALVREAAYAMLTDQDRALGHELAGDWLVGAGERDPRVLAEHFERGRAPEKAADYYAKAAWAALPGSDCEACIELAQRGLRHATEDAIKIRLYTSLASASFSLADADRCYEAAFAAVAIDIPDEPSWAVSLSFAIFAAMVSKRFDALWSLAPRLLTLEPTREGATVFAQGILTLFSLLLMSGQRAAAEPYLRRARELREKYAKDDVVVDAWTMSTIETAAREVDEDLFAALEHARVTAQKYAEAGMREGVASAMLGQAMVLGALGAHDEALDIMGRIESSTKIGNMYQSYHTAHVLMNARRLEEAAAHVEAARRDAFESNDHLMLANALLLLAHIDLAADRLDDAEAKLVGFGEAAAFLPIHRARFLSLFSELRRKQGKAEEAARLAAESVEIGRAGPRYYYGEDPFLLRHAEALLALGDTEGMKKVLEEALGDLRRRAEKIPDERRREAFLRGVPHHWRVLELGEIWLGGSAGGPIGRLLG